MTGPGRRPPIVHARELRRVLAVAVVVLVAIAPVSGIATAQGTPGAADRVTGTESSGDVGAAGIVPGDVGLQIVTFLDDDDEEEDDEDSDADDDGGGGDSDEEDGEDPDADEDGGDSEEGDDEEGDDSDDDEWGDRDGPEDDDEEDEREDGDSDQGPDDEGSAEADGSGDPEDGSRPDDVTGAVGRAVGHAVAVGRALAPDGDGGPRDPPGQVDRPDSPGTDSSNGEASSDTGSSSSAGSTGGDGEDDPARDAAPSGPTAGPEAPDVQASTPTPAPGGLRVANVSTNRSVVTEGEPVRITATVVNEGATPETRRLRLHLFGEVVDTRSVRVPPEGSRRATFVRRIVAPGTYRATVGNASAEVTVEAGESPDSTTPLGGIPDSQGTPGFTVLAALLALLAAASMARLRS